MKREDAIRILITGGAIDKDYDPLTGEFDFTKSHLSNMLSQVRCKARFVLEEVMIKDSLQMRSERTHVSPILLNASSYHFLLFRTLFPSRCEERSYEYR
jgi:L-asparaginase